MKKTLFILAAVAMISVSACGTAPVETVVASVADSTAVVDSSAVVVATPSVAVVADSAK